MEAQQSMKIHAPWTQTQVVGLNRWQRAGYVHEFTCPETRDALIATVDGWRCPSCDYRQEWAHDFMADGPPPPALPSMVQEDDTCAFCLDLGFNRPADSGEFWDCPECGLSYGDCDPDEDA